MLPKHSILGSVLLALLLVGLNASTFAQKEAKPKKVYTGPPVLWNEPTDLETRNLILGAGGEDMKPDISRVTFIEVKTGGWSTKYRVRDARGREWIAKVGKEAQTDTAANRIVWALGYETEIAYLIPKLTIEGKGSFENVRMEARPEEIKRNGNWMWENNPFIGKPAFQGLKILMVMLNNWDMKDDNNEILVLKADTAAPQRYIISDLGATFGKTGGIISRSRNKPSDYAKNVFIEKVTGDNIVFDYGGKMGKVFDGITKTDARWLNKLLQRLSDEQIRDAFRSANYSAADVESLTTAFKNRRDALAKAAN
jgi:hypothetical protein